MHIFLKLCYDRLINNENFEQQFMQNVKTPQPQPAPENNSSKLQLVAIISLAVLTLLGWLWWGWNRIIYSKNLSRFFDIFIL